MTEEAGKPSSEPKPSDAEPKPSAESPKPAISRAKKWRQRLVRIGITVIVVGLLLRISLSLLLPWAINRAAAQFNLTCSYDHMDLYLLDGDVGLWHLVVAPKEGGTPFLRAEYCRGDISTFELLRGHLLVQQAVADGAEVNLERQADGKIPLLDRLTMSKSTGKAVPSSKPGTVDLSPPLRIDALRLQHVSAHVRDLAVSPAVDARFDMDLRLSDLGSATRPAKLWMEASSSPLLDVLRVEGQGRSANQSLDATLHFFVRGLHARPATGYLQLLGIRPVADSISVVADAGVKLTALPNQSAFSGGVSIEKIMVSADDQPAVAVDRIAVDADSVGVGTTRFSKFNIAGVRINADRTSDGSLRLAGFELAQSSAPPKSGPKASPPPAPSYSLQIPFHLGEFALTAVTLSFRDQAIVPVTEFRVDVPALSVKNLDTDSTHPQTATIDAKLLFPGMLRSATMIGTAAPFADRKTADLKFQVDGLRPDAIRPYLEALGIRSELKDGSLTAQVNAALSSTKGGMLATDARVHDIHFRDGPALLDLDEIKIAGFAVDPALTRIAVDDFQITGPKFAAKRDVNGVLSALGFQLDPNARKPAMVQVTGSQAVAPATSPGGPAQFSLPRIDLHHFAWKGVEVHLDDAAVQPATSLTLSDAGIDLSDLHLDPQSKTAHGSPGKIRASLKAPGLAGNLLVDGSLTPVASGLSADLAVTGDGIRTAIAAPYLRGLGIEPLLQDGSLHLLAKFEVQSNEHGLKATGAVSDFALVEDGRTLVSVGSAGITDVDLSSTAIAVDSIVVDKPRIVLERDAAGTLRAAGVRLLLPSTQPANEIPPTVTAGTVAAATQPGNPVAGPSAALPVLSLNHLKVTGAALTWLDHAVAPAITANGSANVSLDHFKFAPNAMPADLKITARLEGVLDELNVGGTVGLQPQAAEAKLSVSATGIRQGMLAGYLPPGWRVNLKDGRMKANVEAGLAENREGGQKGMLVVTNVDYRDGAAESPLLKLDWAKLMVSRLDLAGNVCAIDEISASGFETGLVRSPEGEIQLLGLSIGQAPPGATPTTAPGPTTEPAFVENAGPAPGPALTAAQIVAAHHKVYPLVTLGKLDLGVSRISVQDLTRSKSVPLVLTAQVANRSPINLLGKDPAAGPPVAIRVVGAATPLISGFLADLEVRPFAQQPTLRLDVTAGGIQGAGVTALIPELIPDIDGRHLTDGHFHTHIDVQAKVLRRSPIEMDLSRPFDVDVVVKDLEYREGGTGPLLGGLEEVRSEGIHVDPPKQLVQVRSLEITKPAAFAFRDAEGVHAFGLVVKLPEKAANKSPQTQPAAVPSAIAQSTPPATTQPAPPEGTEVQIAKLLVDGLDVRYEDRAVAPVAVVPLNGLDAEVRDLSSRMLQEDKPVRFNVLVNAGKVSLPKHRTEGAISGAVADLRAMQAGKQINTAPEMEERDLFSQLDAAGKVSLYPQPAGWVKSSLSGFELGEFKGLAKTYGVTLEGGTFDYSADIRARGDGSLDVRLRPVFSDLQVTEPPNGPIVRSLHFPASLDIVLAALRDPEGGIAAPLNVPIKKENLKVGRLETGVIVDAGIGAVGAIVATALASAPIKAASAAADTVSDVVGAFTPFGFFFKKPPPEKPVPIAFFPGETSVSAFDLIEISAIIEKLRKNDKLDLTVRHELSAGDVARAALRANPSTDDARRLAGQLRARRGELLQLRASLIGSGRYELATGAPKQDSQTIEKIRAVQRELSGVEDGLDQMYELLRPGADHLAVRRTRQVALQIAQARVDAVRTTLLGSGIPDIDKRLHITHPQFTPTESSGGGNVTLLIIKKK